MAQELLNQPAEKLAKRVEAPNPGQDSPSLRETGHDRILHLQRTLGNGKVAALIRSKRITPDGRLLSLQTKLTVGAVDDPLEHEAEKVAQQVVHTPDAAVKSSAPGESTHAPTPPIKPIAITAHEPNEAPKTEDPQEKKDDSEVSLRRVLAQAGGDSFEAGSAVETELNASKGEGSHLPEPVRAYMEPRFGVDFGHVRVHTGTAADRMNKAVGAQAFTHASEIYYGAGHHPGELALTAHELTHVVQQGGAVQRKSLQRSCEACHGGATPCTKCAEEQNAKIQRSALVESSPVPAPPPWAQPPANAFTSLALPNLDLPRPANRVSRLSSGKGTAPQLQRHWYNVDIPFTNYQFDPSVEGVKTAASVVKDTAVAGFDWVVDKIRGLVDSGKEWLSSKWNSLQAFASSALDSVKKSFTDIVGLVKSPLSFLADSIMSLDAQALSKAWHTFSGMIGSVADGFKAAADGLLKRVNDLWGGVNGYATSLLNQISGLTENFLFRKLPSALQNVAFSVIGTLKNLWKSINDGWNALFGKVKAWVDGAIDKVLGFVRKVLSFGINVVVAGIVQFGQLVLFLKDLFNDPQKYLHLLAERSVKAFDGVESKFAGVAGQYFGSSKAQAPAGARGPAIQRSPAPVAAEEKKGSASWGEIGHGVLGVMGKKWNEFKSSPMSIITGLLMDMFVPIVGNVKDVIQLFKDIKKVVTGPLSAGSLEDLWTSLLQILDIPILIYKTVVSILMRSLMLPLIVATFVPHPLVKAIAAAVGETLLAGFVAGETANLAQKVLLLKTGSITLTQKDDAYNRIADSLIALAMTAVIIVIMLILHFIANVMKGIFNFVKGKVFRVELAPIEGKGSTPGETPADPNAKTTDTDTAKPKPGSADKMVICRVCDIVPNVPADLMTMRAKLSPEMRAYLDGEAANIFPDPANPTPEALGKLRALMEDAASKGGGDLETGLRNKLASANVGGVTAPIDFDGHITKLEVKGNGDVVGGHSTATGEVKVIPGTKSAPNAAGVYEAKVQMADPANPGQFKPKTTNGGFSTMFPDSWTPDRIKVEVDAAFRSKVVSGNKWSGTTPSGVKVRGYLAPKTTVYPVL